MFPQYRKHFRLPFRFFAVPCLAILLFSRSQAVSEPKGCVEVAAYAKKMTTKSMTIDLKLLSNIISCAKELHSLYQTINWRKIQSMIPNAVRDIIRDVPNLGKKALAVAKGNLGLCFGSVYFMYRAVEMYDHAMSLDMDYKMYRKEFEWLQMELQPVIDQIHNELLPHWKYFSTTTLRKITIQVIAKLDRFQVELKRLVRAIHSDIKKGESGKRWTAASVFSSIPILVASLAVANVPGAIVAGVAGVTSLAAHNALAKTTRKLEWLENNSERMCNETVEYRSLLEQKLISVMLLENFEFLITVSVIVLFVWLQRTNEQGVEEQGIGTGQINGTETNGTSTEGDNQEQTEMD